jgi:hypothetical protein
MGAVTVPTTPTAQIAAGSALFTKAWSSADGSLAGTAAAGAGLAAGLPSGQFKAAVTAATSALGDAEAGAAVGSVIPGYGTAIGAVVGAVYGVIQAIGSGPTQAPEGDTRSMSERYCFPPLSLDASLGETPSAIAQTLLEPYVWANYRAHALGYQTVDDPQAASLAPTQSSASSWTFGVGWISPPNSTAASTAQGYYLAQRWTATDSVSTAFSAAAGSEAAGASDTQKQEAITMLGSETAYNDAFDILTAWEGGNTFSSSYDPALTEIVSSDYGNSVSAFSADVKNAIDTFNNFSALDYAYFYPYALIIQADTNVIVPDVAWSTAVTNVLGSTVGVFLKYLASPDTIRFALAELACLVATGVVPREGCDLVAFHLVLGAAWLWRRGQITEQRTIKDHPNFSRLLGILGARVANDKVTAATATAATTAKTAAAATARVSVASAALVAAEARAAAAPLPVATAAGAPVAVVAAPPSMLLEFLEGLALATAAGALVVFVKRRRRR